MARAVFAGTALLVLAAALLELAFLGWVVRLTVAAWRRGEHEEVRGGVAMATAALGSALLTLAAFAGLRSLS